MVELGEDRQRPPPRGPGLVPVTGVPVRVSDVEQRHSLVIPVIGGHGAVEGLPVTLDRAAVVPQPVVDVAERVPGRRFTVEVRGLLDGGQGQLAMGQRPWVVAHLSQIPGHRVEGGALARAVAVGDGHGPSLLRVVQCRAVIAAPGGVREPLDDALLLEVGPVASGADSSFGLSPA
jgi:hypothetical protein